MHGIDGVRFTELFTDTVRCFGVKDSWILYCGMGMERWEFRHWCKVCWSAIKGE